MKTGILTYHNARNCGAVLQAFALQKTMYNLGAENEIIDYRCEKIEEAYKIKRLREIKTIKELAKWLLTSKNNKKSKKKFDIFKNQNLKLSKPYFKNTISSSNDVFDAFIVGSDQVWNFSLNGEDYTYLLDFAQKEKKKISYAASMGKAGIEKEHEKQIKNALSEFDGVSVREKPLKEYVENSLEMNATLVLDPTLLLTKNDYNFNGNLKAENEKYIFVYTIAATPNIETAARELSKQTGYKIIWGHMSYKKKKGAINKTDISPDEFVFYIKNAEYVLTSSFHGMAFSIIMEKQFFYDLDVKAQNNNSRLETLAEVLGLRERQLTSGDFNLLEKTSIDYNEINHALQTEQTKSVAFLKEKLLG